MDQALRIHVLLDERASLEERVQAAHDLVEYASETGLSALLSVAEDEATPVVVSCAVGEAIAQVVWQTNRLREVSLANFSGPAYLSFDDTVARFQKQLRSRALGSVT